MKKQVTKFFKYRSYTPVPFVILMLIFQKASVESMLIGLTIALIGEGFRFWGVAYAGSETRTTGAVGGTFLVVSGAFGYTRNPLYLGNILLYVGVGVMSFALFPYLQIAALLFFYFQYRVIIAEEEAYLQKTFGEHYSDYKKSVPRFLPKFSRYKNDEIEQPKLNLKAAVKSETRTLQAFGFIVTILFALFLFVN
ncbi:MAG: isoprenylcysteine carboxylmethyltransferase family protein [Melioribacteraceae bacterium]|nr:isoprenylcysteine carboxylmethyltransferase family protein [Melioribacteraceae bacterium]MCF8264960.1 isoprenylcysteine carboxylmethyltransferase family protein [Melioribacteraceae bacterium]MCF8411776.1 isoprenylcysteine carboxylmethyltransferase family protein [Melioribacteraceae bacterium]MCF8432289.1 isoprenylcysteine carboxylmethyltransferase family protein [Melioribacteraceae bacterium]